MAMADCPNCGAALPPTEMSCPACQADVSLWIGRAGQVYGPYSMADLRQAQAENRLGHDDMVMVGNQGRWQPLPGFLGDMGTKPPAPPVPASAPPAPPRAAAPAMASGPPRTAGPPKASGSSVGIIVAVVFAVPVLFVAAMAAIMFPVFSRAREKAKQTSCMSNLKQIDLALLMYCQDYNERFPRRSAFPEARQVEQGVVAGNTALNMAQYYPPDNWRTVIFPYMKNSQIYICPTTGSVYSYQFNDSLYDVEMGKIARSAELVNIFDAGFLDGSAPGPHANGYNAGFVDGHVKWMRDKTGVLAKP
jgi:prepilin-type processing-associated H-X9-DG protein